MKKSFYVEFIGMPASGKSYYQNILIKNLNKKNIITNNFYELKKIGKLFFLFLFFLKYPYYSIKIFNIFFHLNFENKETRKHFYYFINEASLRIYQDYKKKIVINSEGFRYRAVYYLYSLRNKLNKNYLKKFINKSPEIHLIIYVESNKKINIKRSRKRKSGYKYSNQDLVSYSEKIKIIKKICSETKKKAVVIKITKKNQKKDLQKILDIIKKFN